MSSSPTEPFSSDPWAVVEVMLAVRSNDLNCGTTMAFATAEPCEPPYRIADTGRWSAFADQYDHADGRRGMSSVYG